MPNKYLIDEIPDKPWAGQRCWIVGGGKSLKGFDFELLRGENIIAINRAIEVVPFAEIFFSLDSRLYGWYKRCHPDMPDAAHDAFASFRGLRVWVESDSTQFENDVLLVKFLGKHGLSTSLRDGIYTDGNSGHAAVQLAVCLGATTINLLGFDMDMTRWHDGFPTPGANPQQMGWIEGFNWLAPKLAEAGIKVVNMNPQSELKCFPFGQIKIKRRARNWKIISYYTDGTGYEHEIEALRASIQRFGLSYKFYHFPPLGTWRKNLDYKSQCILQAMKEFPRKDIVFIDADGVIEKYPTLFDKLSASGAYDIAAAFHCYNGRGGDNDELLSGTLWIKNCSEGLRIVREWHKVGLSHPNIRHQKCLKLAIKRLGCQDKVYRMPFEYTHVFDYHYPEEREVVIEHYQASRRLRREVGYGIDMIAGQTE